MAASKIKIGIGGWTFKPWRNNFYPKDLPQRDELQYASRKLNSIEINGTYYGTQKPDSFIKWHRETPEDFVFSVKAPRFTTNRLVLAEASDSIQRFFSSGVMALGDKLGPINWQFLPTKKFEVNDFEEFLKLLPKQVDGRPIRHAVEVRHESFRCVDFIELCERHDIAVVIDADSEFVQISDITTSFVYLRLMGTVEKEALGYSKRALDSWAARIKLWSDGNAAKELELIVPDLLKTARRDVFVYVISGFKAHNPAAAMALSQRLGRHEFNQA